MTPILRAAPVFLGAAFLFAGTIGAQSPADQPKFEVATIKPSGPDSRGIRMGIGAGLRNGRFMAGDQSLKEMIAAAYGITPNRVFGPDWLDAAQFNFTAKSPEGVPDTEMRPMLQALLEDRFRLISHPELREMPVYELVVAKAGVKMPIYPARPPRLDETHDPRIATMVGTAATTTRLAESLSNLAGRPVVNKTGLTERYAYILRFSRPQAPDDLTENAPPDLFAAVQEQLGLKLQPGKANLEVIVVDHMERTPSEN